jgi:cytoskeleton protein RodZ
LVVLGVIGSLARRGGSPAQGNRVSNVQPAPAAAPAVASGAAAASAGADAAVAAAVPAAPGAPASVPALAPAAPAAPPVSAPATIAASSPSKSVAPAQATAAMPAAPSGPVSTLVLTYDGVSWIQVTQSDGTVIASHTSPAGSADHISGTLPMRVTIGNAPAVRLVFRGQPIDLAPYTQADLVAHLTLPPR